MPIPKNKKELIDFSNEKYILLLKKVKEHAQKELTKPIYKGKSIKDNLAHVYAWQKMMEIWYTKGMKNIPYQMPAPGYTWKTAPQLNQKIDEKYKHVALKKILSDLAQSHKKMIALMNKHSEKELFTKKHYSWTGSSSLAVYLRLSTYSHYDWALKKFRLL